MFTGIVDAQAVVQKIQKRKGGLRLTLKVPAAYRKQVLGASVAVDGVCLTVAGRSAGALAFDVIPETLRRTRLGATRPGDRLNLERPLKWQGRVHGHLVQGHVDGVAKVLKSGPRRAFQLAFPKKYGRAIVEKGSVTLNGVSLTVGRRSPAAFWVHVIPHTFRKTNLKEWKAGSRVNLETDAWLKAFDKRPRGR